MHSKLYGDHYFIVFSGVCICGRLSKHWSKHGDLRTELFVLDRNTGTSYTMYLKTNSNVHLSALHHNCQWLCRPLGSTVVCMLACHSPGWFQTWTPILDDLHFNMAANCYKALLVLICRAVDKMTQSQNKCYMKNVFVIFSISFNVLFCGYMCGTEEGLTILTCSLQITPNQSNVQSSR